MGTSLGENLSSVPCLCSCLGSLTPGMRTQAGSHHGGALLGRRRWQTHTASVSSGPLGGSARPALCAAGPLHRCSPSAGNMPTAPHPCTGETLVKARTLEPDCLIPIQCLPITTVCAWPSQPLATLHPSSSGVRQGKGPPPRKACAHVSCA